MLLLAAALVLGQAPAPQAEEEAARRAQAALAPFKKALKETLAAALAKSPEAAIDVCAKAAPELARAASKDGVVVGRSALKLRNPKNAPPAWLAPVMAELAKAPKRVGADGALARVVPLPKGRTGYAEAIWVQEPCLGCHGAAVPPALAAKLDAAYPRDQARGFKLGDFRGVFWAELPAE